MDGWGKLVEAATQSTLVALERARRLEAREWCGPDEDLDEEPAECLNCGAYGTTYDGIHFVCEACGDEWDVYGGG